MVFAWGRMPRNESGLEDRFVRRFDLILGDVVERWGRVAVYDVGTAKAREKTATGPMVSPKLGAVRVALCRRGSSGGQQQDLGVHGGETVRAGAQRWVDDYGGLN